MMQKPTHQGTRLTNPGLTESVTYVLGLFCYLVFPVAHDRSRTLGEVANRELIG